MTFEVAPNRRPGQACGAVYGSGWTSRSVDRAQVETVPSPEGVGRVRTPDPWLAVQLFEEARHEIHEGQVRLQVDVRPGAADGKQGLEAQPDVAAVRADPRAMVAEDDRDRRSPACRELTSSSLNVKGNSDNSSSEASGPIGDLKASLGRFAQNGARFLKANVELPAEGAPLDGVF